MLNLIVKNLYMDTTENRIVVYKGIRRNRHVFVYIDTGVVAYATLNLKGLIPYNETYKILFE